jgi:hypothetical protein
MQKCKGTCSRHKATRPSTEAGARAMGKKWKTLIDTGAEYETEKSKERVQD